MATDRKTIRSYDNYVEEWAKKLRHGENVPHEYLEKPAMYSKLPSLKGKSVLCIGCGTGEECEHLRSLGAKRVVGVDISKGLIEYAKKSYPDIEFHVMDMERLTFHPNSFDFVYSSLTMHYVKDWGVVLKNVKKVLKKGGTFLFSTHHPIRWGSKSKKIDGKKLFLLGYEKVYSNKPCRVYGDYLTPRKIKDNWFGKLDVTYYNKPISKMFKEITKASFEITDMLEPKAVNGAKKKHLPFWQAHQKVPLFIIFELKKK